MERKKENKGGRRYDVATVGFTTSHTKSADVGF